MPDAQPSRRSAPIEPDRSDDELIDSLVKLGVSRESAEDAVHRGDPESVVFEPVFLEGRAERTVTPGQIEEQGGMTVSETVAIMQGFGLPTPAEHEGAFSPAEAEVLVELGRLREIWPYALTIQLSRVYGRTLSQLASSEAQAFWLHTVPYLRARDPDEVTELGALRTAFERLLPLADPLILGVHRRWIEHELGQAAVRDFELRAGTVDRLPGAGDVAFLFCDLKDFTHFVEVEGDGPAIAVIDRFFEVVTAERGEGGRLVKSLGDGAMLVYADPVDAVAAGARVIAAIGPSETPGVHASVHFGAAIAREGDYFGSAVNLAARLLTLGARDQLIATGVVVEASEGTFAWEPMGERIIRGVADPLAVYRLLG